MIDVALVDIGTDSHHLGGKDAQAVLPADKALLIVLQRAVFVQDTLAKSCVETGSDDLHVYSVHHVLKNGTVDRFPTAVRLGGTWVGVPEGFPQEPNQLTRLVWA